MRLILETLRYFSFHEARYWAALNRFITRLHWLYQFWYLSNFFGHVSWTPVSSKSVFFGGPLFLTRGKKTRTVVHYRNILQSISIWCVIWEIHFCGSASKLHQFFFLFRKQLVVMLHLWEGANYWNQGRKLFSFFNSPKKNISRWWYTRRQIIVTGARDHLQTKCTVGVWEWMSNFIPRDIIAVITYPCWY